MSRLDEVLARTIEGFLHYDLTTMAVDDQSGKGVAYPILISTFAGIEFLGALLSQEEFQPVGKSASYFSAYWRDYLYPPPSNRAELGGAIYKLVRNGLAHSFAMRGRIGVLRKEAAIHLVRDRYGVLVIDAVQLARDFLSSYRSRVRRHLTNGDAIKTSMEERLAEMERAYARDADNQAPAFLAVPLRVDLVTVAAAPAVPQTLLES